MVRWGWRAYLQPAEDIVVVGEAASRVETVALARERDADVVLMDSRLAGSDGLAAIRELTGRHGPRAAVVVVTTADEHACEAFDAGAVGLLLKDATQDEVVTALRTVARGHGWVTPSVARHVIGELTRRRHRHATEQRAPASTVSSLTAREIEIVRALGQGMSNAEIGSALHLVPGTVKCHLARISAKIGTRDRVQTVVWAYTHGILPLPSPEHADH
ncbi:DNA-binding response regulator [Cellulomonas phragmiteti]|uniref:DNA-binding response regulator n=1 Tax=Cellulomonas phragmiteti TaxID=478780 RepID=A0ABQ4DRL8_9CELL|nr:DNA-binding response regulator [Cellulomonas phragmiteti]